jgi:hypothetical protein
MAKIKMTDMKIIDSIKNLSVYYLSIFPEDWTQGLANAMRALYHWVTPSYTKFGENRSWNSETQLEEQTLVEVPWESIWQYVPVTLQFYSWKYIPQNNAYKQQEDMYDNAPCSTYL